MTTPRPTQAPTAPRADADTGVRAATRPVSLHIDRLVLEGLALTPAQGVHVQRALERELLRLWAARAAGGCESSGASPLLRAPAIVLDDITPARLGRDVARSLFTLLEPS